MNPVFQWVYAAPTQKTTASPTTSTGISSRIEQAFDAASGSTGTSFQYLLDTARRESSLRSDAKASTSSASGLFQFVEGTWLKTLKEEGPALGLGQYADAISKTTSGRYQVTDPSTREAILALRDDPDVSALVAGAFTRRNAEQLKDDIGRDATSGELYIAHFLGAKGASSLIGAAGRDPQASAADLFPQAARANPTIFYDGDRARSVAEVYSNLTAQHGGAPLTVNAGQVLAKLDRIEPVSTTVWDPALGYSDAGSGATHRVAEAEAAMAPLTAGSSDPADGWRAAAPTDAFSSLYRADSIGSASSSAPAATKDNAIASFWKGFSLSPGLFQAAVADDTPNLSTEVVAAADTSAALRASQPGQILDRGFKAAGPLNLASFLNEP